MRYRLAILGLVAVLGVLPALTTIPAAPAPKSPKMPEIYALIYVGLGKNDPDNAKRISHALQGLPSSAHRALSDPKVRALPIVQDKEKELGTIGRNDWAKSKLRAASLEGTAVVRVWFTDGSPQEQVLITNAFAREYVEGEQRRFRGALEDLERYKRDFKAQQERAGARVTEKDEKVFRRKEEAIKHLPHVIEWGMVQSAGQ
jgi:hypothetical protein